eukprot:1160545-Pelagomonas_calceolata.AAC.5
MRVRGKTSTGVCERELLCKDGFGTIFKEGSSTSNIEHGNGHALCWNQCKGIMMRDGSKASSYKYSSSVLVQVLEECMSALTVLLRFVRRHAFWSARCTFHLTWKTVRPVASGRCFIQT